MEILLSNIQKSMKQIKKLFITDGLFDFIKVSLTKHLIFWPCYKKLHITDLSCNNFGIIIRLMKA